MRTNGNFLSMIIKLKTSFFSFHFIFLIFSFHQQHSSWNCDVETRKNHSNCMLDLVFIFQTLTEYLHQLHCVSCVSIMKPINRGIEKILKFDRKWIFITKKKLTFQLLSVILSCQPLKHFFSDFNFVSFITDFFREVKPLKNEMREIWHWNHKSN